MDTLKTRPAGQGRGPHGPTTRTTGDMADNIPSRRIVLVAKLKTLWAKAKVAIDDESDEGKLNAWRLWRDGLLVECWALEQALDTPANADLLLAAAAEGLEKLEAKLQDLLKAVTSTVVAAQPAQPAETYLG